VPRRAALLSAAKFLVANVRHWRVIVCLRSAVLGQGVAVADFFHPASPEPLANTKEVPAAQRFLAFPGFTKARL
jgi:hypothetical protein